MASAQSLVKLGDGSLNTQEESRLLEPASPARVVDIENIGTTPKRWIVLALYMLFGFSNQLQYVAYVTIIDEVKTFFSVHSASVNALPAIFSGVYIFFVFPGCKVVGHLGLKKGLLLGAFLNFLGSIIKLIAVSAAPWYWLLCVSSTLNAFAQILFLGLPALVASIWFPEDERTLATALGTLTGFVGMAVGLFYSPRVLHDCSTVEWGLTVLFISQAVICGIPFLGLFFISDAPDRPPSVTANSGAEKIPSMMAVLKRLICNKNFMVASTAFGSVVGLFTALATVLTQVMKPLGLSEGQTGILGFAGILSGAFACAVVSPIIDKFRRYKIPWLVLLVIQVTLITTMVIVLYTLDSNYIVPGFVLVIMVEMTLLPQFPVVMELSVELTYPEPESISVSAIMIMLSIWSVVGTVVFSIILGNNPTIDDSRILMDVMLGVLVTTLTVVFFFVDERLVRKEVEASTPKLSPKQNGTASTQDKWNA